MAETTSSGGIGFAGLLTVLFIALKLTHVVSWSWLWVLAPLWIGFAAGLAFLVAFFTVVLILAILK